MKKVFALLFSIGISIALAQSPQGLKKGEAAPHFTAADQNQENFELAKALEKGPVVLVFYRGAWCPYCNQYLSRLTDSAAMVEKAGATVVAVSPDAQDGIQGSAEKTKGRITLLRDGDYSIMKKYKVDFETEKRGVLPVPATYLISKNGEISYRHFDEDYKKRASVKAILEALNPSLAKGKKAPKKPKPSVVEP